MTDIHIMLNSKNVATLAIVAIVLALGAAGIVTMMTQVSYATAIPLCGVGDHKCEGQRNACLRSDDKPKFCND